MNPQPTTQELLGEHMAKLPYAVRATLGNMNLPSLIGTIASKNKLRTDQAQAFERELLLVLLGLTNPDGFVGDLIREASLDRTVATAVANDSAEMIFKTIRTKLRETEEKNKETDALLATLRTMNAEAPTATQAEPTPSAPANLPVAPSTAPLGTVQTQMSSAFRMAPDSVTINKGATPIPKPTPVAPVRDGKYASADPYREPVN